MYQKSERVWETCSPREAGELRSLQLAPLTDLSDWAACVSIARTCEVGMLLIRGRHVTLLVCPGCAERFEADPVVKWRRIP